MNRLPLETLGDSTCIGFSHLCQFISATKYRERFTKGEIRIILIFGLELL
jgi:hypothetical protein